MSLAMTALALIPVGVVFGLKFLLGAAGFWQNFAILILGGIFLGGVQIWFLIFLFGALLTLWAS